MGLVDQVLFRARGAHGSSSSDYEFALTTCCERVGVLDRELEDFFWDCQTLERCVSLLERPDCPFCGSGIWSLRPIDDPSHVPEHWRWACDAQPRPGRRIVRPLSEHVAELLGFCRRGSSPPPPFEEICILNTADPRVRYDERWIVSPGGLQSTAQFAPIFDQLLVAGYPWINLSAYGIFRGALVIGIELPRERGGVPAGLTSVNYSGPSRVTAGVSNWQLDLQLTD